LEPKLDGRRALVYLEDDQVEVRTRRGRSITEQVPDLAGFAEHVAGHASPSAAGTRRRSPL
jgi:ATP-dependent DNA ligase